MGLDLALRYPTAIRTGFGDSAELSALLLDLIRAGGKTATCGALRDYQAEGEPVPQPGDLRIAEDWNGEPALVYEVTEVTIRRFADVPEDFALAEGEGSFADWQQGHRDFFARNGGFSDDLELVCERFRLIEVIQ
ncbi:ASCH domain-containing protein [Paracoccus caeni]|uniref:ASCH domain-containing protein n=1 Tax=Paracoccus caeni TaxID=657651 RepID=A0A934VZH1_9RHOB|nr:ASCH domain-containing protein [Paracoccus caeni]MBK4215835.1 ASCH domain-containing protein [Paracoccus caeni]